MYPPHHAANLDSALNRGPILLYTNGNGTVNVITPANSAVAPTVPRPSYMNPAKSGKTAANVERIALFDAMALAAMGR